MDGIVSVDGLAEGLSNIESKIESSATKNVEGISQVTKSLLKTEVTSLPKEFLKTFEKLSLSTEGITRLEEIIKTEVDNNKIPKDWEEMLTKQAKSEYSVSDLSSLPEFSVAGSLYVGKTLEDFSKSALSGIGDLIRIIDRGITTISDVVIGQSGGQFEGLSELDKLPQLFDNFISAVSVIDVNGITEKLTSFANDGLNALTTIDNTINYCFSEMANGLDRAFADISQSFTNLNNTLSMQSNSTATPAEKAMAGGSVASYIVMAGSFKTATIDDIANLKQIIDSLNSMDIADTSKLLQVSSSIESINKVFESVSVSGNNNSEADFVNLNKKVKLLESSIEQINGVTTANANIDVDSVKKVETSFSTMNGLIGTVKNIINITPQQLVTLPLKIKMIGNALAQLTSKTITQALIDNKNVDPQKIENSAKSIQTFSIILDAVNDISDRILKVAVSSKLVSSALSSVSTTIVNIQDALVDFTIDKSLIEQVALSIKSMDIVFSSIIRITKNSVLAAPLAIAAIPGIIATRLFLDVFIKVADTFVAFPDLTQKVQTFRSIEMITSTLPKMTGAIAIAGVLAPLATIGSLALIAFFKAFSLLTGLLEQLNLEPQLTRMNKIGIGIAMAALLVGGGVSYVVQQFAPENVLPALGSIGIMTMFMAVFALLGVAAGIAIGPLANLTIVAGLMFAGTFLLSQVVTQLDVLMKKIETTFPKKERDQKAASSGGMLGMLWSYITDSVSMFMPILGFMLGMTVIGIVAGFCSFAMIGLVAFSFLGAAALVGLNIMMTQLSTLMKSASAITGDGKEGSGEQRKGILGALETVGSGIVNMIGAVMMFSGLLIVVILAGVLGLMSMWAIKPVQSLGTFATAFASAIPSLSNAITAVGNLLTTTNNMFASLAPPKESTLGSLISAIGLSSLAGMINSMSMMGNLLAVFLMLAGIGKVAEVTSGSLSGLSTSSKVLSSSVVTLTSAMDNVKKLYELGGSKDEIKQWKKTFDAMEGLFKSFGSLGKTADKNVEHFNKLDNASKILGKSAASLTQALTNINQVLDVKTSTDNFRISISDNIAAPLMQLDKPISKLEKVTNEVKKLNTELTKLSKDNKETLKGIGSIGEANEKGISLFVAKLESSFKRLENAKSGGSGSSLDNTIILEQILQHLAILSNEATKKTHKSWSEV
jgi:hypothetical protein